MSLKVLDTTSDEATVTDTVVGAPSIYVRYRCPDRKRWTYDPNKHMHFYLPQTAGPAGPTAGTRSYFFKAGNEVMGSKTRLKEIVFERLPSLANQASSDFAAIMKLPPFTIEGGQEFHVWVDDSALVVTAADSTHSIEVDETEQAGVAP